MRSESPAAVAPLVALLVTGLAACGGATTVDDPDATPAGASVTLTEEGRLALDGAVRRSDRYAWLVPASWPAELEPPLLGVGALDPNTRDLELWAATWTVGFEDIVAHTGPELPPLGRTKHACSVVAVDDDFATIDCGEEHGITSGDLYFVLNRDPGEDHRMGARIGALLRVSEVADTESVARVEHARIAPESGQPAVFAQASFDLPSRNANIVVAPFRRDGSDAQGFPAVADALPDYLADFGLTNVGVRELETFIDPRPFDAAEQADEAAGEDYGCVVFGEIEGDTLVFNASAYGSPPHPATTVGILPGGLPLPIRDDVESLSRQLVPSFLATVLALRGDHALAAYFLESVLDREELEAGVRYHLREHLALRYESMGFPTEALRLMAADIEASDATDDTYALLNALSIRSHLDEISGLPEQWVADSRRFLEVAEGVLPDESLERERLDLARAIGVAQPDESDESIGIIMDVLERARQADDVELQLAAYTELAFTMMDDPAGARLALAEAEPLFERARDDNVAVIRLMEAEFAVAMDDVDVAERLLGQALEAVADSDVAPLRASVYRRAAGVFSRAERYAASVTTAQEATRLYLDTAQLERAAGALVELAFLELELMREVGGDGAVQAIQQARQNILLGSELSLRLGKLIAASRAFMWAAFIESELGQTDMSEFLLERSERFALASGNAMVAYELYAQRGTMAERAGDLEAAEAYNARSLVFAAAAGIEVEGTSVEARSE